MTFSNLKNVPDSCCLSTIASCGQGVLDLSLTEAAMKIHTEGCLDKFSTKIQENVGVVGGVGIGIGFLQVRILTYTFNCLEVFLLVHVCSLFSLLV